ncbi:SNARE associated Golgi protein [uncultured archaeon]|nr:SNARE associated Golgi protein [uncultured archaeon]
MKEKGIRVLKLVLFLIFILLPFAFFIHFLNAGFSFKETISSVKGFGFYSPLILLLMVIIGSTVGLIFQIPVVASAFILDFTSAAIIDWLGLVIGAVLSFYLARYLARDYFHEKFVATKGKFHKYESFLRKRGFVTILFLRLIYIFPYELLNIFAGLSEIRFKDYFIATLIGTIPGVLLTLSLMGSLKNVDSLSLEGFLFPKLIISLVVFIAFIFVPLLSKKVRRFVFHHKSDK